MGECSRCGKCCMYLPISKWRDMNPAQRHYLDCRAILDRDTYIVKVPCPYLKKSMGSAFEYSCGVEDNKPEICRIYVGKPTHGKYKFWIPKGCTMAVKDDK